MDFSLTDEQAMFQDSARRFAAERAVLPPEQRGFDRAGWQELADQGFLSIGLPESIGGIGGAVELAVVCQEFGRGPVLEPYVGAGIFPARLIVAAGSDVQQAAMLPAIAAGELIIAVAYREAANPGWKPRLLTTARRDRDGFILSGQKSLVLGGPVAGRLIVSATLVDDAGAGNGTTLFLVEPDRAGVTIMATPLVDGSWAAEVVLDRVKLSRDDMLGAEHEGEAPLRQAVRFAMLGVCGEIVGTMMKAVEITAGYIKLRRQFGAPLSDFQVLRHRIADMTIDCEMAEAAMLKMIASFEDPDLHDPAKSVALAKILLDELSHRVCGQAIQLHGGMGLTEECEVGRYFTRATAHRALFGSASEYLTEYVGLLTDEVKASGSAMSKAA